MAHQKLGNGQDTEQETDIAVVAPVNMGKGLIWDEATGTYYIALNSNQFIVDELGNIKLRLSAIEDNQIQERPDGFYIGNQAREELRDLYVANHGDDNNPGTRESPLRTIKAAVEKLENVPAYYHIWLHEGHTFDWAYVERRLARIVMDVYGPQVDSTFPMAFGGNAYYRGYTAKHFPRPTVHVRVDRLDNIKMMRRQAIICGEITVRGITFNVHNKIDGDDASYNGSFTGIFDCLDSITFHGCLLNEVSKGVSLTGAGEYRNDVLFRAPRILWIDSLMNDALYALAASSYTSQLSLISWNNDHLNGYGQFPNHEALIKSATAFQDMGKGMFDKLFGVYKDRATKQWHGIEVNFDIFST